MKKPYLSIIATSRNDNHGGDLLQRNICFVNGIYHQAQQFNMEVELIIVEWNPPGSKPLLKDVLPKPPQGNPTLLRYIIVPNKIHEQFKNSHILPLHQMIAKNVGIRRAKGEFILCTNIDILFSTAIFKKLSQKKLSKNIYYRTSRCDVPRGIMQINQVEEQLKFAEKNIIKRLGYYYNFKMVGYYPPYFYWFTRLTSVLDRFFALLLFFWKNKKRDAYSLNYYACGDFTLMHKTIWEKIQGYYELEMYPLHIDSLALISAYSIGIDEFSFNKKECIYHIDHADGWESEQATAEDYIHQMERRPGLEWVGVLAAAKKLEKGNRIFQLNKPSWGLKDVELEEYIYSGS